MESIEQCAMDKIRNNTEKERKDSSIQMSERVNTDGINCEMCLQ